MDDSAATMLYFVHDYAAYGSSLPNAMENLNRLIDHDKASGALISRWLVSPCAGERNGVYKAFAKAMRSRPENEKRAVTPKDAAL